jgi:hypothetical protein
MIIGFPSPADGTSFSVRSDLSKRGKSLLNKPAYAAICSAFGFLWPVLGPGFDGGNAGGGFISSLCKIIDR